jgi:hypothetical protein
MAIVTNTVTRYDGYRAVREDLADVIYNISPVDVPMMSNIGRENVKNTYFEWQVDVLASAVTTNAQLEGDDVSSTTDARTPTNRVANYTQISRKLVETSGTLEAVDKAGMRSYMAYELAKASSELKRDMEATITSNNAAVAGNNTTARQTAGLGAWLRTNVVKNGSTDPSMSSTNDGYPQTARTLGTQITFTEAMLKSAIQKVWTQGGDPKVLMVGPFNKTVASTFAGIAQIRYNVGDVEPAAIIGAADVYLSDFGEVRIVPNRFQPERQAYVIDPEYASIGYLRNFRTEVLAKTGDAEKRMIIVEYGLKVRTEKSHAIIADLTTS